MSDSPQSIPCLTEEEVGLLLEPDAPSTRMSAQPAAILIYKNPDDIFTQIARQRYRFHHEKMAEMKIRTLVEAEIAGDFFSSLFTNPAKVKLGIMELVMNAIEHGNLEITSEEKAILLKENRWIEEIERRLDLPDYQHRYVHITCQHFSVCTEITVVDEGNGFDWRQHLNIREDALTSFAGRGIACAQHISFDEMHYIGSGNIVKARQFHM